MKQMQITSYQAVIAQARAYRSLRSFMVHILEGHNLTVTQWLMLGTVVDSGSKGVRVTELAHILGVELPVITNLVNRAEKAHQVTRKVDSGDKRSRRVCATSQFVELACLIEGEMRQATQAWLQNIDTKQISDYFAVVNALGDERSVSEMVSR